MNSWKASTFVARLTLIAWLLNSGVTVWAADEAPPPTEAKTLEQMLEAQQTALKKVFETVPDGDYLTDSVTEGAGKRWCEKLLGAVMVELDRTDSALSDGLLGDSGAISRVYGALERENSEFTRALKSGCVARAPEIDKSFAKSEPASGADQEENRKKVRVELLKVEQTALWKTAEEALANRRASLAAVAKGETLAATQAKYEEALRLQRQQAEQEFLKQFEKSETTHTVVECVFPKERQNSITCNKSGLSHGGVNVAAVVIRDLPADSQVVAYSMIAEAGWVKAAGSAATTECAKKEDASCDEVTYPPIATKAGQANARDIVTMVHTNRVFGATFREHAFESKPEALERLRRDSVRPMVLIAEGRGQVFMERLVVKDPDGLESTYSLMLPFAYERWGFESGSFFAVSDVVDQKLTTELDESDPTKVKVAAIRDADKIRQESGIYLNLIPRNYEYFSIGVGFHTSSDRSLSYYAGLGLRLRSFGDRALASFGAGIVGAQRRVFPGVEEGKSYSPNDKLLEGTLEYKHSWYALISLGFRFGPIGAEVSGF